MIADNGAPESPSPADPSTVSGPGRKRRRGEPPDGGWGWVVAAAAFVSLLVTFTVRTSFSILYLEWAAHFHSDLGQTGWAGSLHLSVGSLLSVVFSVCVEEYGCRAVHMVATVLLTLGLLLSAVAPSLPVLYLSYGILGGLGSGMKLLTSFVVVPPYFTRRRAVASGLSLLGISAGLVIAGPLTQGLVEIYGWRGTLVLLAGLSLQGFVVAATFRPLGSVLQDRDAAASTSTGGVVHKLLARLRDVSVLRVRSFVVLLAGTMLMGVNLNLYATHIPSMAVARGLTRRQAAWLWAVAAMTGLPARVIISFVANAPRVRRVLIYGGGCTLSGVVVLLTTLADSYSSLAACVISLGAINGGYLTVMNTVLVDLVGVVKMPRAQGYWTMALSTIGLMATPFIGYLYETTGSYEMPLYVSGGMATLGGLLMCTIPALQTTQAPPNNELPLS